MSVPLESEPTTRRGTKWVVGLVIFAIWAWPSTDDNDREWLTECSNDALTEYAGGDAGWACDADGCWEDGSGYQWDSIAIDYRCEAEWLGDACSESSNQL
jgi:hypothetical protein